MDLQWIEQLGDYQFASDENMQKCLNISYTLGEIGKGGNYSVASLLEGEDFKCLSEDHKAKVFSYVHWPLTDNGQSYPSEKTCMHKVADHDIPTYLQQILPYMPLHKFQSCSLSPGGFPWVESEEWMRDMLVKHKVRWYPDSSPSDNKSILQKLSASDDDATFKNDGDIMSKNDEYVMLNNSSLTDEDTIHKLRDLAFTMMAAELFYICLCCKAIRCCRHFLSIAPNLVKIHAGKDKTVALCTALMYDSSEVVDLLLEHQAPICNIGQAAHQVFLKSDSIRSFEFITNILHHSENRDKVRFFQDQDGNTILHLLIEPLLQRNSALDNMDMVTKGQFTHYVESCIQTLLAYGVDPHTRNDKNETVLDVLFMKYVNLQPVHTANLMEIFLRNLELILPSWGVALPGSFPRKHETVQDRLVMLCKIAELLLNDEHSLKFAMRSLQNSQLFGECKPSDSQLCLPAVSLFYQAMLKGIDMHNIPGEPIASLLYTWKDYVSYLLHVSSMPKLFNRNGYHNSCNWALLELLVHSGNDVFSQMDMRKVFQDVRCDHVILYKLLLKLFVSWFRSGSESYLDYITSIMSMLSMYAPLLLQKLLPGLLAYRTRNPADDREVESMLETIAQIHKNFERVRPLKLLCRLKVLGNVAWKDVEKLPLPPKLKHYVRIGNIPDSHVIHQIIDGTK